MDASLECDECGTLNDPELDVCELCGDPLGEERDRRLTRSGWLLAALALGATAIVYGGPGLIGDYLLYTFFYIEGRTSMYLTGGGRLMFWGGYTLLWGAAIGYAPSYDRERVIQFEEMADYDDYLEARDQRTLPLIEYGDYPTLGYDFEDRLEHERAARILHKTAGCLLIPFHVVRGLWSEAYRRLVDG